LTLTGREEIVKQDFPIALVSGKYGGHGRALTDEPLRATVVNVSADASLRDERVALVTGGASGIGAAVVNRLAANGVTVVIADRDLEGAERTAARIHAEASAEPRARVAGVGRVEARGIDVSDFDAVDALVDWIVERHGRLDNACNCAGVTGVRADLAEYPEAVFRRVLEVDAGGVFACLRAELGAMASHGGGRVVNIASGAAALGVAGSSAYVAAKHAVAGLTRTAAIEYAARGIAVNAVSPGLVMTDAVDLDVDRFVAAHPSGRPVTPEEIADVVAWLLLDAPPQLTGALIPIDGGLTAQIAGTP
jgi:NAD(P)-dependent dehydrogenase (short-subunit alcohol dehydrogenase family)